MNTTDTIDHETIWQAALARLQHEMTRATFERWLLGTTASAATSETITVVVRDSAALAWLGNRLKGQVERALKETGHPLAVLFVVAEPVAVGATEQAPLVVAAAAASNGSKPKRAKSKPSEQPEAGARFEGFPEPESNYSKVPHALIDALPLMESEAEVKLILYILRHTWGYQDPDKRITLDEFEQGRKRADGTRIDKGVGMSRKSIIKGLRDAEAHGFIKVEINDNDLARIKKTYSLAMNQG